MSDEDVPAQPKYKRLESEQRTKVTRDWSVPCWAGTSDKLVMVQRLAEDCLERAWLTEVNSIKAEMPPDSQDMWIEEAQDEYALKVSVRASGGRITKTGELSTILADTDLRDVESVTMSNEERASQGTLKVSMNKSGVKVSAVGPDLQWVYGTIETLSTQIVKDRPWWSFFRQAWFGLLMGLITGVGLFSLMLARWDLKDEDGSVTGLAGRIVVFGLIALVASGLSAVLFYFPTFAFAFPAFDVIERGSQATGRKVLGGFVTVLGLALGLAGLITSLI